MYKKICVTNRTLVSDKSFEDKISEVLNNFDIDILILREKDLNTEEFLKLSEKIKKICDYNETEFYINSFYEIARKQNVKNIALPLRIAETAGDLSDFENIIISIHDKDEIKRAENIGATALMFGNIYETNCKPGKAGRGVEKLKEIVALSSLPIYAIGGINDENQESSVLQAGAKGIAKMSSYMTNTIS